LLFLLFFTNPTVDLFFLVLFCARKMGGVPFVLYSLLAMRTNPRKRSFAQFLGTSAGCSFALLQAHSSGDGVPSEEEEEELEIVRRIKSKQQELREK